MRSHLATVLLILIASSWAPDANAQVDVELELEQEQFLRDEPVPVKVRITNRSGQTLKLGESTDWVKFNVEIPGKGPVERSGQPALATAFELESARQATREINIQPWFELSLPGRYSVSAVVRIRQWDRDLIARAKPFEIVRGAKLWEQEIGVPATTGQPEVRRYVLQQANYRKQLKLYLRISNDSDTYAFNVLQLGSVVSFGRPEAQVDEQSNLHVLFQTGARSFNYCAVDPAGNLLARQSHEYGASRPMLRLSESGKIIVAGGVRRIASSDFPSLALPPPATPSVSVPPSATPMPDATDAKPKKK